MPELRSWGVWELWFVAVCLGVAVYGSGSGRELQWLGVVMCWNHGRWESQQGQVAVYFGVVVC